MTLSSESRLTILALLAASEVTGPLRGLFQLVDEAKDRGFSFILGMFLVDGYPSTPAIDEAQRRGFDVRILHQRARYDPRLLLQTLRIIRQARPASVQSHGYKSALIAWLCRRAVGIPWVAFSHGYTQEDRRIGVYNRLDRWLLRGADRVVAVSQAMARGLVAEGIAPHRIRVVHNAVDPDEYPVASDRAAFRREVGAGPGDVLLGVIGRLSPEKGQRRFVEAFQFVAASEPAARAVLVGDGPERGALEREIEAAGLAHRIALTGHRRDIGQIYPALDVIVIPSLSEGLPNVLLEAMLMGKAIVATAVGGIPEVLEPAAVGWLVQPGDRQALAAAVLEAVRNPEKRESDGRAGARYVRQHFAPARRAGRIVEVYREVMAVRSETQHRQQSGSR